MSRLLVLVSSLRGQLLAAPATALSRHTSATLWCSTDACLPALALLVNIPHASRAHDDDSLPTVARNEGLSGAEWGRGVIGDVTLQSPPMQLRLLPLLEVIVRVKPLCDASSEHSGMCIRSWAASP